MLSQLPQEDLFPLPENAVLVGTSYEEAASMPSRSLTFV